MAKPSRVVILAEDHRHQRFAYRYLQRLNVRPHEIYFEPLPSGRGCGEQWVRERYAKAVAAYRQRSTKAISALVVFIDADTGDVDRRIRQFHAGLEQHRLDRPSETERIVHLILCRNMETWILCLHGAVVDEQTDYSREPQIDEKIPGAAVTLFHWSRPNTVFPSHCVPSLQRAIPELRRLD